MVQFQKVPQGSNTWRILDGQGNVLGRVWSGPHIDRLIRDGDYAEGVAAQLGLTGTARRAAVRTEYGEWVAAGGRSVDFSGLTTSLLNDGGIEDSNLHVLLGGVEIGYLNGITDLAHPIPQRIQRFVRLAEESFAAEQIAGTTARNNALDAAVNRFRDAGALA